MKSTEIFSAGSFFFILYYESLGKRLPWHWNLNSVQLDVPNVSFSLAVNSDEQWKVCSARAPVPTIRYWHSGDGHGWGGCARFIQTGWRFVVCLPACQPVCLPTCLPLFVPVSACPVHLFVSLPDAFSASSIILTLHSWDVYTYEMDSDGHSCY